MENISALRGDYRVGQKEKKHILIVSQIFYPDEFRINDITLELKNRGFSTTVITGYPNYPEGKIPDEYNPYKVTRENYKGIEIIRLPIIERGKNNKLKLILNYASFPLSGYLWNLFTNLKADAVFIYEASPMSQALPGVWYAKKQKIPCYIYVTDLWPENVQAVGNISNPFVLNLVGKMVDYIYARCHRIFIPSQAFIERVAKRGVAKEKIEYWPQYAEDYYYPMGREEVTLESIPQDNILNLTFAGNIGYAQGLELLPQLALKMKESNKSVRFNLIGDGRYKQELISQIKLLGVMDYFNFIERQPAEEIKKYMVLSDASLILLSKDELFELYIPAKVQSSLACAVPIIGSISGETKRIIEESESGYCSEAGDMEGLYNNIMKFSKLTESQRQLMKENALRYYRANFEKEKLMDRLEYWLACD